jgi:hypothetical protein
MSHKPTNENSVLVQLFDGSLKLTQKLRGQVLIAVLLSNPYGHEGLMKELRLRIMSNTLSGDAALFRQMYWNSSASQKTKLLASFAAATIEAGTFVELFLDAFNRCRQDALGRASLACSLSRYMSLHPFLKMEPLRQPLLGFLRSRRSAEKAQALLSVGDLRLSPTDLRRVLVAVESKRESIRANGWIAVIDQAERGMLSANQLKAMFQEAQRSTAVDPALSVRHNAAGFVRRFAERLRVTKKWKPPATG